MDDDQIAAVIRCPRCRAFDWYRDGFAMRERADGTVERLRLTDSADEPTRWSCAQCGYEVPDRGGTLHIRLNDVARA